MLNGPLSRLPLKLACGMSQLSSLHVMRTSASHAQVHVTHRCTLTHEGSLACTDNFDDLADIA